uniref:DNA polymerase subunit gamma-1 n=1 Tax=Ciona savignyi TaxID=51511 RepID=H2YW38_CIOSA
IADTNIQEQKASRYNKFGIQMLPEKLQRQIFKETTTIKENKEEVEECIKHLVKFGLWGKEHETIPDYDITLPQLFGNNVDEHFQKIASDQSGMYKQGLLNLASAKLPKIPVKNEWARKPGWSKYSKINGKVVPESVECPTGDAIVFDCEVLVSHSETPIMAVAVSNDGWFSWTSPCLDQENPSLELNLDSLIPMEQKNDTKKLIIGHNVGYDRARVREQYYSQLTNTRFLDTMSMHIAVSGFNGQQRILSQAAKSESGEDGTNGSSVFDNDWVVMGSTNSLKEVHKFYCKKKLDKEMRDIFVTGNINDVKENFQDLMWYCAKDVKATHNVLTKLTPLFFDRFPHPVTFAGMLEMGQMYLPVNNNWFRYIQSCKDQYDALNQELKNHLRGLASDACHYAINDKYKDDKWLWDLDWNTRQYKLLTKPRKNWVRKEKLPIIEPHMPGAPKWFSELCVQEGKDDWKPGATLVSTLTRTTPKLLRMMWMGCPLHYVKDYGWGYLWPSHKTLTFNKETSDDDLLREVKDISDLPAGFTFHRLPHNGGTGKNVGSPLAREFISHVESGLLSSYDPTDALRCLEINKITSYWRSSQKRVQNQLVVEITHDNLRDSIKKDEKYSRELSYSAIVPQAVVCGAVSRRAVERVWLTASNPQLDRIGSELKAMVQAPPGYSFVGADVDSQELWIASLLGDASSAKEHGCTALSWMTLRGNKRDGTDLHSTTAASVGMSRDQAKVFNYARMYGAGKRLALRTLMQYNKDLTKEECVAKVNKLYDITKGEVHGGMRGIESHMFNKIEEISNSAKPETPTLGCKISRALEPGKVKGSFATTRMNWVVQSSAVDYLHLLLVAMRWLIKTYNLDARFVLSIHDEVRYLSNTTIAHEVALALQISNILTRSMFAYKLDMHDLPLGVAFFSSIEVDSVVRKTADDNCITPSNAGGLKERYGIPLGHSFDIDQIL